MIYKNEDICLSQKWLVKDAMTQKEGYIHMQQTYALRLAKDAMTQKEGYIHIQQTYAQRLMRVRAVHKDEDGYM
jgi:hypothetical protein